MRERNGAVDPPDDPAGIERADDDLEHLTVLPSLDDLNQVRVGRQDNPHQKRGLYASLPKDLHSRPVREVVIRDQDINDRISSESMKSLRYCAGTHDVYVRREHRHQGRGSNPILHE